MEPIPETAAVLNELDSLSSDPDLLTSLTRLANHAQGVVPDLVGVSIARLSEGLTFTLVASAEEIAVLDGIQYAAGGPCVEGAHQGRIQEFVADDVMDEARWQMFAEATAAHTVRSTLTLPIVAVGEVQGTVNLYAATRRAFTGHHGQLAEIFGAWAAGAVTNADLSFRTRSEAKATLRQVRDQLLIDVAAGILAARLGIDVESADQRLREASARAGTSTAELAREIIRAHQDSDQDR